MSATINPMDLLKPDVKAFVSSEHKLLIGGQEVPAESNDTFETLDPATGRRITAVAHAGPADVTKAVRSAQQAMRTAWGAVGPVDRAAMINRFADLIEANTESLAQIESLESGKPVEQIKVVDIPLGIAHLRYCAGWTTKIQGETVPVASPGMHVYTRREPVGVVAAIVPWNFSLCQSCFKIAPALAAGCAIILKPAEQTPLTAIRLGQLALEAGIPEGVLNVLTGFGETTGQALVDDPGVAKIAFTGSEPVGKLIAERAAVNLKHVSLELGGKSPNIIFADADLDAAVATAAPAIFFYTGQVCTAGSRLLVQRNVQEEVTRRVVELADTFNVGHGLNPSTTMGPLVSAEQLERVSGYVEQAKAEGVTVECGGSRFGGELSDGYFHQPTVITNAKNSSAIAREEVFGPVLVIQPFDDVEDLVKQANDTQFGLAAGVWTRDVSKAHVISAALEAGTVWVNTYNQFDAAAPFGGYKQSGYGRDGGKEGLDKYLQTKTIWINHG